MCGQENTLHNQNSSVNSGLFFGFFTSS